MELLRKLKDQGWHISNEGLSKLPEDVDKSDTRKVIQALLDIDLRDVGTAVLPAEISRKEETVAGRVVVQIVKIRNISAPKANEESKTAPRFLHLELTDGVTQAFALEFEQIASLSLNTPPGTKIYLRSDRIPLMQGILVLRPADVQVLGGEVAALVEKWEISRTMQKYARGGGRPVGGTSGPPPWIPFGQKIQQLIDDKNFKSLAAGNGAEKEKDPKDNEFDTMRSEAIAEAAKSGAKKVFGGGHQQMLDHNVKKIIEKGFSEIDAKNALRTTRNNLERALYNLKRRDEGHDRSESKEMMMTTATTTMTRGPPKRGPFKETKRSTKEEMVAVSTKPAGNVSLFDFLTDKLPANAETISDHPTPAPTASSYNTRPDRPPHKYDSARSQGSSNQPYGGGGGSGSGSGGGYQSQNSIPGQSSSSASAYQQQQANRPKFENNISSSFANRTTGASAGESEGGYRGRNRGGRGGGPGSYSTRQPWDSGRGGGSSTRNLNRPSQERERGSNYSQDSRDHRMDSRNANDSRPYKPMSSRFSNKPSYAGNSGPPNGNRNYSDSRNALQNDSDGMKELIEDTSKLKIDNRSNRGGGGGSSYPNKVQRSHSNLQQNSQNQSQPASQQQQQQHRGPNKQHSVPTTQQQQAQLQQQHAAAIYTQLPNGFAYDPSKIMGFQNKESNEYALSMLKGQSGPSSSSSMQATQSAPQPTGHAHYSQPPPQMQLAAQQTFHPGAPPPQFIMQATPQHVQTFGIQAMDGATFNWKIGDRCLAKYWDDARYYEAEITGLSDKTCVVLFLGYGNYEEVLKSDCLPLTGASQAIVATHQHAVQMQQIHHAVPPPPTQQQANARVAAAVIAAATGGTTGGSANAGRYRGERQMYVPPPKRET